MLLKIKKRYKGDEFRYKCRFIDITFKVVKCRQLGCNDEIDGEVNKEITKIILSKPFHIEGIHGESPKDIHHLTIPKDRRKELQSLIKGTF